MKKNIIALCLVVSLAAIALLSGTMAYFTDTTEKKTNAFTVGNVEISLAEPSWTASADHTLIPKVRYAKDPTVTVAADSQDCYLFMEVSVNKYNALIDLMGIDAYSDGVTDGNGNKLNGAYSKADRAAFVSRLLSDDTLRHNVLDRWFDHIDYSKWTIMNKTAIQQALNNSQAGDTAELSVILGYSTTLSATDEVRFMSAYGMPAEITQDMLAAADFTADDASTFNMSFTAYAIQKAEINTMDEAYSALFPDN